MRLPKIISHLALSLPSPLLSTMAWQCSATSNTGLVDNLKHAGLISSPRVEQAMKAVDRGKYVELDPYEDSPQPIGYGATISAPHMHASALQYLEPFLREGDHALDVGSGSGYLVSCMARLVGTTGKVVGIDHIPELVEMGRRNIQGDDPSVFSYAELVVGDGRLGYVAEAPYAAIHVGAAAYPIPDQLIDQLKSPGRMIIPVGKPHGRQELMQIDKDEEGNVHYKELMGVMFVPLTDKHKQV
ncbi:protein-L-isoaspartateD-aspartate O-methyltransferase [Fimicolochytrium jonesii]|uniref:protein-L-isoaspartateD-aspartate O-methyltransferase n=1 Tax=Fimicolochytrium jonesii TaxID=1396493 RepID=UPI0022FF2694|nr:protein-L-isoaspartateD-aspartate O-methyltransferase [Fimicolochytrium jonesii]KAI8819676.1 protein-L-isoaspartateD-aspartate O-methyltransferase [Fimicolochytrium jonesii]